MERIYDDAKDKNVAAVIVYNKQGTGSSAGVEFAYKDASKTEAFTSAELKDAFIKGCLVKYEMEVEEEMVYVGLFVPTAYGEATSDDPAAITIMLEEPVSIYATDPEA